MNTLTINSKKLFLNNIDNEKLGFYFSFFFHLLILLFAIGMPNFFERDPINVPNIIPIEIVNISDVTSIPKEKTEVKKNILDKPESKKNKVEEVKKNIAKEDSNEIKKFNNSTNQEIEKMEIKQKPKIEKKILEKNEIKKEDIVLEEKNKKVSKIEKKVDIEEKIETLPTKKIKPKIKPKPENNNIEIKKQSDVSINPQPKPKPEPKFSIASMLKDLRNEKSSLVDMQKEKDKKVENKLDSKDNNEEKNLQLSISEIDLLRQQLSSCWIAPAGAVIEKGMLVKISAKLQQNRRIYSDSVRILDTNISKSNPFYGPITESAMRTLLNPDCIPLKLPEKKYSLWKNLIITFDYSIMRGY